MKNPWGYDEEKGDGKYPPCYVTYNVDGEKANFYWNKYWDEIKKGTYGTKKLVDYPPSDIRGNAVCEIRPDWYMSENSECGDVSEHYIMTYDECGDAAVAIGAYFSSTELDKE